MRHGAGHSGSESPSHWQAAGAQAGIMICDSDSLSLAVRNHDETGRGRVQAAGLLSENEFKTKILFFEKLSFF